jgi:hypothetical protein
MKIFDPHIAAGIIFLIPTILFLAARVYRAPKRGAFRWWGHAGLVTILAAEALLFLRTPWVTTFFTPLVWTGYLLLVDALVASLRGESLLGNSPRRFLSLAFWSVPLWLIFEAYNLRLQNWAYVGLPGNLALRDLGYAWSFATIWPAIFETADLVGALGLFSRTRRPRPGIGAPARVAMVVCGLALVTLPVLVPQNLGRFLFGAVWIGFILLLDPLNYYWKGHSFLSDFESGNLATLANFLAAGWTCGILWEFWNYWAAAKWVYIFPIGQSWKVFEMPLAGYLGFLPFALECKVLYEFLRTVRGRLVQERSLSAWEMTQSRNAG